MLKKRVTTSRALAAANGTVKRLPNPYMLINTIALQEAKASTAIENILRLKMNFNSLCTRHFSFCNLCLIVFLFL
ncbi:MULTISPECIES: Fic/DOC family N-terminal domain-containing protein [unclassified Pedobacter]|uniref:Fic/DOC family N-terminal domain-containing protein n=1 Tax=Pedobacter sp. ok626 TaxID=1761882 RepID=UPI001A9D6016